MVKTIIFNGIKSETKERPFSDLCQFITHSERLSPADCKAVRVIVALLLVELRVYPDRCARQREYA